MKLIKLLQVLKEEGMREPQAESSEPLLLG